MKPQLIILLVLISAHCLLAKNKADKITTTDLETLHHSLEHDAAAAVLYQDCSSVLKYNETRAEFEVVTEFFIRVKVYNPEGTDRGTYEVDYFDGHWNKERISHVKGATYNLQNGKVVKQKLEKSNIFDEQKSKYLKSKKFVMPSIKAGSIYEIKYRKTSGNSSRIPRIYFQYDIPCDYNQYTVEVPDWFQYNKRAAGSVPIHTNEQRKNRKITLKSSRDVSNNPNLVERKIFYEKINYMADVTTYSATHIPSLKDEDHVPCMNNYRSSIAHELLLTKFPKSSIKKYNTSWSGISKMLWEDADLGKQLKVKLNSLNNVLNEFGSLEGDALAKATFDYVRDEYKWNENLGHHAEEGIKKVLKSKTGNVGDINLLLANIMQKSNLDPILIATSTRDKGFINIHHPSQQDLNYLIVGYKNAKGQMVLLDATDRNIQYGQLPTRAVNMNGITILPTGGTKVIIANPNKAKIRSVVKVIIAEDEVLEITSQTKLSGFLGPEMKDLVESKNVVEDLETKHELREYSECNLTQDVDRKGTWLLEESFTLEGVVEELDDFLYINSYMGLFDAWEIYTEEERKYPIFNDQMTAHTVSIKITIPEGYRVESIPDPVSYALPEGLERFSYNCAELDNSLIVTISKKQKKDVVLPEQYKALKNYSDLIAKKSTEKIVLVRI